MCRCCNFRVVCYFVCVYHSAFLLDAVINRCDCVCVLLRRDIMNEHGVLAFYAEDVRRLGIETVVRKCIDHVSPE